MLYFFKKRKLQLILEVSKRRIKIKIYFPYISLEIWNQLCLFEE